jgi:hypothetical protein
LDFQTKLSASGFVLSVIAIGLTGFQAFIQWKDQRTPFRTNLYAVQLQACTDILTKMIAFSNTNAEIRLIMARQRGAQSGENMYVLDKTDMKPPPSPKEEAVQLEVIRNEKTVEQYANASAVNETIVSRLHLFERDTRGLLSSSSKMVLLLTKEPEGTAAADDAMFYNNIELFRSICRRISDDALGNTVP